MFKKIKANIISQKVSIEKAINKMEASKKKILLVVSNKKFIGTVTDGDFRRFFFNEKQKFEGLNILNCK